VYHQPKCNNILNNKGRRKREEGRGKKKEGRRK
jgi:hypothetical protein